MERIDSHSSTGEDLRVARRNRKRGRLFTLGLVAGLAGLLSSTAYVDAPEAAPTTAPVAAVETNPIRDTEPEAIVAAAELDQPVEVLSQRGEYRDVFAQPDGTLIANEYNQAVRVLQGETWVPADATLVAQPDGTFAPTAALLDMRLSGGGSTPLMVAERDSRIMTLTWPNPLPTPVPNGDQLVYPEVFPDVDLVANVTVEGFSHVLVLKTPDAANLPELQNLQLGVTGQDLDIQETADGGVVALDPATSNPVMEADAPTMWDSGAQGGDPAAALAAQSFALTETTEEDPNAASAKGPGEDSQVAQVDLDYSQGTLRLTPDPAMLADPDTTYPVYVDPVWQSSTNSAWAMVDSGYPSEEYWKFDGKRHERIGLCPSSCNNSKVKRLFYRLATPYAGKTILEATFRVTLQHVYNSTARAAALYLMPAGISSSTNWGNQPGGSSWSGATLLDTKSPTSVQSTCTSTNQNTEWNAKTAVQRAVANGWSTVTLGMRSVSEGDSTHTKRFCDNGVLSVRYNRAPLIAKQSELSMSPGGTCVYGTGAPYTDVPPRLNAIMRDPDHSSANTEQIKAEFKVTWTPTGGSLQTRSYVTPYKASGSLFNYYVPSDIAENVPISWEVRASDGVSWGPWSSEGSDVCQFYYDKSSPAAPDVDSPEYLPNDATDTTSECKDDQEWRGSIGVQGTFTFDSAATDVVEYQYNFNDNPTVSVKPTTAGGPVTITWTPDKEGPRQLFVKAIDQAKRSSTVATCTFRVGKRPPIAQWPLSDIAAAKAADDTLGSNDARIGSGVTFDQPESLGKWDTAAVFDGTSNAYLVTDTSVVADTSKSFAITGWFRVDDVNRRQVAVSQDGTGEPGFSLGVDQNTWFFRMPTNDVINLGEWKVTAGTVTTGWTFVAAAFDGPSGKLSLQIGEGTPVVKDRRSLTRARGALQFGRHTFKGGGYSDFWKGAMADISVFDRPAVNEDIVGLDKYKLDRKGYWQLSTQAAKASPNYDAGGEALLLGREDSLAKATNPITGMMGAGYLLLKGQTDQYAETATPLIDPSGSFTITARVRFTSGSQNHPMTAISLKGANNSSVVIRGNNVGVWEMAATSDAAAGAEFDTVDHDKAPSRVGKGDHIALVYNGYTRELLFYLNGQPQAIQLDAPLPAVTSIQFGRAFIDGNYQENLSGAIDDIRVYTGLADKVKIDRTSLIVEQPNL